MSAADSHFVRCSPLFFSKRRPPLVLLPIAYVWPCLMMFPAATSSITSAHSTGCCHHPSALALPRTVPTKPSWERMTRLNGSQVCVSYMRPAQHGTRQPSSPSFETRREWDYLRSPPMWFSRNSFGLSAVAWFTFARFSLTLHVLVYRVLQYRSTKKKLN